MRVRVSLASNYLSVRVEACLKRLDHAYQIIKWHGVPPDSPLTELLHGIWYMMRCRSRLYCWTGTFPPLCIITGEGEGGGLRARE